MKSKYQQYSEQIAELEEVISKDEDEVSKLQSKCTFLKTEYENKQSNAKLYSDSVFQKFIATVILTIILCTIFVIANVGDAVITIIIVSVVIYNIIVWEDRSSRNEHEREAESKRRELSLSESAYNDFKATYDKKKKQYLDLKEQFATWKTERENLLRELAGKKPYQYFDFPFDPVIDDYYYPVGTLDEPEKFMIYTANAHRYHKQRGCSGAYKYISIGEALENNQTPCLLCFGYSNDFDYPDWIYTVHDKYFKFVHKLEKYDISAFIDSNHQLSVAIPIIENKEKTTTSTESTDSHPNLVQSSPKSSSLQEACEHLRERTRGFEKPDPSKFDGLLSLLEKYPEFSNGEFSEFRLIDGKMKYVFKKNLPLEIKLELKKTMPKQLWDTLNQK